MKHPVLRVKKGKETYDDRENMLERQEEARGKSLPPTGVERPEKRQGSFFRMRRGSLLPLLILVVIAAIVLRVLPRSAARANIDGWHALLEARVFGDTLRVGVAFSRIDTLRSSSGQAVSILFILPDTGEQVEATGTLSEPRVALRSQMRYVASEKTLRAVIRINGQSRTLSLPISGPPPAP